MTAERDMHIHLAKVYLRESRVRLDRDRDYSIMLWNWAVKATRRAAEASRVAVIGTTGDLFA